MNFKFFSLTNLLSLLAFLSVWLITATKIQPFLYYSLHQIGFISDFGFLKTFLKYPGGFSDYLANFFAQFFAYNTLGSFLYVLIAAIPGIVALDILRRLIGRTRFDFLIFGIILLVGSLAFCDYNYPFFATIRLLLAFLVTWIFCIVSIKYPKMGLYFWPVAAAILFFFASGPALIVFGLASALIQSHLQNQKRWIFIAPAFIVVSLVIPLLAYKFAFPSTMANMYSVFGNTPLKMLEPSTVYQLYIYYSLLPTVLFAGFFLKSMSKKESNPKSVKGKNIKVNFYKSHLFVSIAQLVILFGMGYFLFVELFNPFKQKLLYIEYYAENEKWDDVLKTAEGIDKYDFRVNYQINHAYANLSKLPEQLFNYPQLIGSAGLFLDNTDLSGAYTMPISDLYFDLGLMSESLHWAFEAQTLMPYSPRILKRIVLINLINREYGRAEKFLNVLAKNSLCHEWVNKYQKYIVDTTMAAKDPLMAEKRLFTPHVNTVNMGPEENLKLLLQANKRNKMAYDYLLCLLILDSKMDEFVKYVQYYPNYNIKTLPPSWEEALSYYIMRTKSIPSFVNEETISKGCMNRLEQVNGLIQKFSNNKGEAQIALRKNFENTFWYYILFLSPEVNDVLNNVIKQQ